MDLLPAYRALVASPEQQALCDRAGSVAQLLQQLRTLWQLDTVGDGPLIAELNRCNRQVLDLDGRPLAGRWFPCEYHPQSRSVSWCLPVGHATEPFQDQYIARCRQQRLLNQFIRPRTAVAPWLATPAVDAGPAPAGFIFHLSRCGSTLLSGCLAEPDRSSVLSESPLLTDVLLDASLSEAQKRHALAQLIRLQAAPFPGRDRIIVKWNAWDLFAWPLIRAAFPGVPSVLLFRDPEEILASHGRSCGRHMAGDPSLARLHPALADAAADGSVLGQRIGVLRALMAAMAAIPAGPKAMRVDYAQLDFRTLLEVCRHFALEPGAEETGRIKQRMAFHSKVPARAFEADGPEKKRWFDPDQRERIRRALAPGHRRLLASCSQRRPPGSA